MSTLITPALAARLVSQALDRESLYWMDAVFIAKQPYIDRPLFPPYSDPRFFAGEFQFTVVADDSTNTVDRGDIERSWSDFQELYPEKTESIQRGKLQYGSADLYWQICVFGQIVYNP